MARYESYKHSGMDWLGEIPSHWELVRLKHIFSEKKKVLNFDLPAGSISFGKVIYKNDEKIPESTKASYQEVLKGEFLINPLNLNYDLISLRIGLSEIDVVVSSGYIVLKNIINIHKDYYKWLLHIYDVMYMKLLGSGVRQTISFNHIANSELAYPPIHEQEAIAAFLDEKCGKIDALVEIKSQQIDKLKELRQVKIHQAVTKGISDTERSRSVEMKDSGIDWIGEIPKHWEVRRFKFLCSITTGSKNTEDKVDDGLYPFYVRSQTAEKINSYSYDGEAILTAGDGAGVGKVYHYVNGKFDFHQRVYKFSDFNNVIGKYLFQFLYSEFYNVAILGTAKSTVDSLRLPLIQDFMIAFPNNKKEQEAIVTYLEEVTGKIDQAIAQKQEQIEKLKQYKQSLINEVVTGKVKVA